MRKNGKRQVLLMPGKMSGVVTGCSMAIPEITNEEQIMLTTEAIAGMINQADSGQEL